MKIGVVGADKMGGNIPQIPYFQLAGALLSIRRLQNYN